MEMRGPVRLEAPAGRPAKAQIVRRFPKLLALISRKSMIAGPIRGRCGIGRAYPCPVRASSCARPPCSRPAAFCCSARAISLVDLIWIGIRLKRGGETPSADALPAPARPGRLAIFVPAWDEAAVIGAMLDHAQAAFGAADYLLYVGCYPNDPATIAAVRAAAGPRVRLVVGPGAGADQQGRLPEPDLGADGRGRGGGGHAGQGGGAARCRGRRPFGRARACSTRLIERFDLVQLPVRAADRSGLAVRRRPLCRRVPRSARQGAGGARRRSAPACPRPGVGCAIAPRRAGRAGRRRGARPSIPTASPRIMSSASGSRRWAALGLRPAAAPGRGGRSWRPANISRRRSTRRSRRRRAGWPASRCRLGPARLERRPRRALDAAARPPVAARRSGAGRRLSGAAALGGPARRRAIAGRPIAAFLRRC